SPAFTRTLSPAAAFTGARSCLELIAIILIDLVPAVNASCHGFLGRAGGVCRRPQSADQNVPPVSRAGRGRWAAAAHHGRARPAQTPDPGAATRTLYCSRLRPTRKGPAPDDSTRPTSRTPGRTH